MLFKLLFLLWMLSVFVCGWYDFMILGELMKNRKDWWMVMKMVIHLKSYIICVHVRRSMFYRPRFSHPFVPQAAPIFPFYHNLSVCVCVCVYWLPLPKWTNKKRKTGRAKNSLLYFVFRRIHIFVICNILYKSANMPFHRTIFPFSSGKISRHAHFLLFQLHLSSAFITYINYVNIFFLIHLWTTFFQFQFLSLCKQAYLVVPIPSLWMLSIRNRFVFP